MARARKSKAGEEELRILGITFPIRRYADGRAISWYYSGSGRVRVTRSSEAALRKALEDAAVHMLNGQVDVNELGGAEARAMVAARDAIAKYRLPMDAVAREYAAARELLGEVDLMEACRFYKRHAGDRIREQKVSTAIVEFLLDKADLSDQYREQLRKDLGRFSKSFGERMISEIESTEIAAWVAGTERASKSGKKLRPGAARRNQLTATVATFFSWARNHQYLMRGRETEAELVKRSKHVRREIEILRPADLQMVFEITAQLDPKWLPFVVLAGMSGIRSVTLQRLEWRVVHWNEDVLQIPAAKSKIARRYLPPFLPAAKAWLADWKGTNGAITPAQNPRYFLQRVARRAGWRSWPKNVLRKSFISYRMATLKNAAAVALEANTSVKEIQENYLSVSTLDGRAVTAQLGEEYFGLMPTEATNVIPMLAL